MRDRVAIRLFALLLLQLGVLLALMHNASVRSRDILYVQSICDEAHSEISGASEMACGNAQDETNTEYLCNSYAQDAYCWVEVK